MANKSEYLQSLTLEDLRLRKLKVESAEDIYNPRENMPTSVGFRWRYNEKELDSHFKASVLLDFSLVVEGDEAVEDKKGGELFKLNCTLEGLYLNKHRLDKRVFNNLTKSLYVVHFWPYIRELAQTITFRFGLKPIVLPSLGKLFAK